MRPSTKTPGNHTQITYQASSKLKPSTLFNINWRCYHFAEAYKMGLIAHPGLEPSFSLWREDTPF